MAELHFKGKEFVYNHHLSVPYCPLVPNAKKSTEDADLSGNLIIHGDNLVALKALLPTPARSTASLLIHPTTPVTRAGTIAMRSTAPSCVSGSAAIR